MPRLHPKMLAVNHTYKYDAKFIDSISDPVLIIDGSGDFIAFNESLNSYFQSLDLDIVDDINLKKLLPTLFGELSLSDFDDLVRKRLITRISGFEVRVDLFSYPNENRYVLVFLEFVPRELLYKLLDNIPTRIFWKNREGRYLGCNKLFALDVGVENQQSLIGLCDYDLFSIAVADRYSLEDKRIISTEVSKAQVEEPQIRVNGDVAWVLMNKSPMYDSCGNLIGIMGSYIDISEQKKYQQLMEHRAKFDILTELPNRLALQERFQTIDSHYQKDIKGGLLFIDLAHFKSVNDSLGHKMGDQLLLQVAHRIRRVIYNKGFVVRLGGDEFSVLVVFDQELNSTDMHAQLETIAFNVKDEIVKPYHIDAHHIHIGVNIGITKFMGLVDWDEVFHEADSARYYAKSSGKNTIYFFDEHMREYLNYTHMLQSRLSLASRKHELFLEIQPQFNYAGEFIGSEALLRWNNEELGLVPPSKFIPLSEKSGTIHMLGMWVFKQAFKLMSYLSSSCDREMLKPMALNVSVKQFQAENFIHSVEKLLNRYPLDPHLIQFELTESLFLEYQESALDKLQALRDMGFSLAIDDFGTGYSCLSYVSRLPIDKLKIDQSFTQQIIHNERQAKVVETIISMAKSLDLGVVAEGVETEEQVQMLAAQGCYEFQGFYFSKPMKEAEFVAQLKSGSFAKTDFGLKKISIN